MVSPNSPILDVGTIVPPLGFSTDAISSPSKSETDPCAGSQGHTIPSNGGLMELGHPSNSSEGTLPLEQSDPGLFSGLFLVDSPVLQNPRKQGRKFTSYTNHPGLGYVHQRKPKFSSSSQSPYPSVSAATTTPCIHKDCFNLLNENKDNLVSHKKIVEGLTFQIRDRSSRTVKAFARPR